MECPNCENSNMELENTDSRQEWYEEEYFCGDCKKSFVRRVEFQTQSELVESDEIKEVKNERNT